MVACFRAGYVALPCTEQLRAHDLRLRLDVARPGRDRLRRAQPRRARGRKPTCPVLLVPDESLFEPGLEAGAPPHADAAPADPCLITFTSGTAGEAKAVVHGQRYLDGQRVQAEHWLGAQPGDLVWCTAASGWSKSARNVFIAPWIRGARGAAARRALRPAPSASTLLEREGVNVLCMAPTEYRVIAARAEPRPVASLRRLVAAGEALNPEVLRAFREATGLGIRDGYGQTETGPDDRRSRPARDRGRARWARPLPGVRLWIDDGELCLDPRATRRSSSATSARACATAGGAGGAADRRDGGTWRTGDRVTQDEDGYLYFEGRADDVIITAGYRIGPFEVESALVSHPAVAEAAAVAAPDAERGSVVRAVVVLRDGHEPSRRSRASSRITSRRRRRRTSTRGSSSSPTTCRRPRAARCAARCCATAADGLRAPSGPCVCCAS